MFQRPGARPEVPAAVRRIAGDRTPVQVWHNDLNGLTYLLGEGPGREFVKWCPHHPEFDLEREAAKLTWAGRFVTVPRVLAVGSDADGSWLHTAGLPGRSAVDPWFLARPALAATGIGRGLRRLHDRLPVDCCPYDWSVSARLAAGRRTKPDKEPLRAALGPAPEVDRLVVCHGDACSPNTLLADDGSLTGHVDLDGLGIADRWADLAVASYALTWNFAPDLQDVFFAAYGIAPDPERIAWYRALWDAT